MFPTGSVIFVVVATIGTVRSQSCLWFADEQLKNIPGLHRISDQDVALRNVPWGYVCCNVAASVYTAAIQDNNYWSVSQDSCNSGTGVPQGLWPAPVMGDLTPVLGLSVKRQTPTPEYPEMVCPEESGYVPCLISLTGDVRQYLENYRQPCRYNPVITVYCHTYLSQNTIRSDYAYARTANDSGGFVDKDDSPKWDLSENLWIYVSELSSAGTLVVSPECGQLIVFDSDTWGTERWTVSLKVTQSGTSLPIVELASDLTVYPTAEPLFDTQGFITNEAEAMHTRVALRLIQKIPYSSCVTMSPRPCLFDNVVTATNPTGTASSIIVSVLIFDENDLPPAFQPLNSGNTILLEHGDPNQASQLPSVRAIDGDSGILCPIRYTMDSGGDIFAVHPSDGRITFASGITHLAWNATTESNVYNLTVRAAEDNSTYTPNPDYTPTIQACRVEMFDLLTLTVQFRARTVVPTTTASTGMSRTNTMGQATSPATSAIPATSIVPNTSTSATNSTALTDGCPAETKRYPNGELFHWRPVSAGQVHVVELGRPLEYCPDPYFRRICVGNPVVGFSSILPTDPCPMSPELISPIVALLASNLTAFPPDPSSREMLATSVAQAISSPINILTVTELNYLAIFLQLNTEDVTVIQQNLFYLLVNIIGQLNSGTAITQLQTAQNYSGSSNTIYSSLEGLANAVYLGAGHRETVTANVPNLVIRAFTIPRDAILTERSIVGVSAKEHATDISDITHGNRLAAFSNDIAVSIVLPESLILDLYRRSAASLDGIRGQYLVLRENALLQISPSNTHDHDYDLALPRIASWVIGASFEGPPIVNLPDPITFTAKVDRYDSEKNHTCVFWNISAANGRGTWESHGCTLTNQTGRQLTCQCNHLTSFAILVDFYAADYHGKGGSALPKFLDDLTTAALALSISGLLFTLCAIVLVCKLSKAVPRRFLSKNEFVIINLSVALLGSYTTFLAGVDRVEPRAGCVAVGCLIHYFFLVAFCWEAVEGFLLYKAFAPATATAASVEFRHFRAKTCALAWGIPLIIVGIILITNPQYYVGPNVCWLQNQTALFVAFITPICLTLLGNLLVFVIVMKGIWKREAIRSTKAKENIVTDLRRGMSLFFLLGLPWLLLMLNASHGLSGGRLALHILIVIFCGTQGFGIFAVQVFGMRKELKDLYRRRRLPQSPVHSTQPSPGNAAVVDHPSVSSPSSSPSLEAEPTDKKDS